MTANPSLSVDGALVVSGTSTLNDALSCKGITADGDLTVGTYGTTNLLKFNANNNSFNTISVNPSNQMLFNANN